MKDILGDLGLYGRIILKWITKQYNWMVWTTFVWRGTWIKYVCCVNSNDHSGGSWVAEQLSASKNGLYCVQFIGIYTCGAKQHESAFLPQRSPILRRISLLESALFCNFTQLEPQEGRRFHLRCGRSLKSRRTLRCFKVPRLHPFVLLRITV
jgi:hypothetical protein